MTSIGSAPTWRFVRVLCATAMVAGCAEYDGSQQSIGSRSSSGGFEISNNPTTIDGDTGLGPNHRAPGVQFHHVIDVSAGGYSEHAIKRGIEVFNERTALDPGEPDFIDISEKPTIAVLLPSRTENRVIGINSGPNYGEYERADMDLADKEFNIHFIGPWCAGPEDTKVQAMTKVRDDSQSLEWGYFLTCKDANNNAIQGGGGGHTIRLSVDSANHSGEFHFWCMNIEGSGRSIIAIGTASNYVDFSMVTGENDVHLHLVRLHQDNIRFTSANFPFWGVSSWHTRVHVHGYYSDLPWNSEHHFYLREEPYGDMTYEYVSCDRAGGQIMQKADRDVSANSAPQAPLIGDRTDPGTNYYRHFRGFTRTGRWAGKASSFFTQFASHQAMDFEGCVIVAAETDNCRRNWPPPDPYGDIKDEPFNFNVGGTSWTHYGNGGEAAQQSFTPNPGYVIGPIKMRRCVWYLKRPTKDLIGIRSAPTVDIEDCGFFSDAPTAPAWDTGGSYPPGSRSIVAIGAAGRGNLITAPHIIGSLRWVRNCQPTHIEVLTSPPFNIPAGEIQIPSVVVGSNRTWIGTADKDVSFDHFTGESFQAGSDPLNLVVD